MNSEGHMNDSKHTPGPWRVSRAVGSHSATIKSEGLMGETVAMLPPKSEANARLIAAAPDLLAALEVMVDLFGDARLMDAGGPHPAIAEARAAIARAKGESK